MTDHRQMSGGQVSSAMVGAQQLGLRASYIGKVGYDNEGRMLIESLQKESVDCGGVMIAMGAMANSEDTTIKTFEFKLRVNKSFVEVCERELEHSRQIYNAALAERISCYQITGQSLGYVEQSRHLTDARALPEVKGHLRSIQQDALERVDEAFEAFFRRVGNGEKPGFPRFKGKDRYHTFSQKYERVRPCPLKGFD